MRKVKKKRTVTTITRARKVEVAQKAAVISIRTQVQLDRAKKLHLQIERLQKQYGKLTTDLKKFMGDKEVLVDRRKRVLATYEKHFRTYIERKQLEQEFPEVFAKVAYEQEIRAFRLS